MSHAWLETVGELAGVPSSLLLAPSSLLGAPWPAEGALRSVLTPARTPERQNHWAAR